MKAPLFIILDICLKTIACLNSNNKCLTRSFFGLLHARIQLA